MLFSDRKSKLLRLVIREYTRTAEPVGSGRLSTDLAVSPATIRFELAELEDAGFLTHPHTSAGRIPTEEGYRYYIEHFLRERSDWVPEEDALRELYARRENAEALLRSVARMLADATGESALAGFDADQVFYTGLANLFGKPEFRDTERVVGFGTVLDRLHEVVAKLIATDTPGEIRIVLGHENPFGDQCGSILMKVRLTPRRESLLGLLGPMRMDYERNVAVMRRVRELFEEFAL